MCVFLIKNILPLCPRYLKEILVDFSYEPHRKRSGYQMNKYLFLPVEIFTRSFNSRLRIAFHFATQGGSALVGDQALLKKVIQNNIGSINYLSKGEPHTDHTIILFTKLINEGSNLFLLDEEGGIIDQNGDILKFRYDKKIMIFFKKIYLWGENSRKYFKDIENEFIITGNPRFDKLSIDFSYLNHKFEISHFINKFQKRILINSSFPLGNNIRTVKELLDFTENLLGNHFNRETSEMHIASQHLMFLYLKKLIRIIAQRFNTIGIIIRPHPSENPKGYKDLVNQFSNIYIDKERKFNPATLSSFCDLTIHHDCTTGIEALISGSKVISFVPFQTEFSQPLPLKSSRNINSYEEVIEIIDEVINGIDEPLLFQPKNVAEIRHNIINFNQDQDTALIIAEDIYEAAVENDNLIEIDAKYCKEILQASKIPKRSGYKRIKSIIKDLIYYPIRKKDSGETYRKNKKGSLTLEEAEAIVERLNNYYDQNVIIKELTSEIFLLKKRT